MERRWSNELGVLWIPWEAEEPARRRLRASRSVDFALASRPAAVMLVAAMLAQSAAAPVSALAQGGKDPVGWLPPNEGGSTADDDNVPDGQAGDEDQPDTSVDPAPASTPAPPAPTPEPVQTPAPTPEAVATPASTPAPAAAPEAVATATPAVTAVPEAPPSETPPTAAPPAPVPAETPPPAAAPVVPPTATATPELRVQSKPGKRRAEAKRPARRIAPRPVAPAPPAAPARSTPAAATTAPAAQPSRASTARIGARYEVQPGDSLWRIAERLLGPRASVKAVAALTAALWERNQDRIGSPSPDVLPAGITILIPRKDRA